jgi:hypothetical protein
MAFYSNALNFPNLSVKSVPVSGDIILIADSAASNIPKQTTVGDLASTLSAGNIVNVTASTQAMSINTTYVVNYTGGACTLTLPSAVSSAQGSFVRVIGGQANTAGFVIAQNASQQINVDNQITTAGVSGSLTSATSTAVITLESSNATGGLVYSAISSIGNFSGV